MGTTTPLPMADENKSVLQLFKTKKEKFLNLFKGKNKKEKEREEFQNQKEVIEKLKQIQKAPQVDALIANFRKLELEKSKKKVEQNFQQEEEDELKNFTYKIINDDHVDRNKSSQSSDDSGFFNKNEFKEEECLDDVIERKIFTKESECETKNDEASEKSLFTRNKIQGDTQDKTNENNYKKNTSVKDKKQISAEAKTKIDTQNHDANETSEDTDDVTECFKSLNLEGGKKQKRVQTVALARGPIRNRVGDLTGSVRPYEQVYGAESYRQISQINKHTLSGGQVIVNTNVDQAIENEIIVQQGLIELSAALVNVSQSSQIGQELLTTDITVTQDDWEILQEIINEESVKSPQNSQSSELDYEQGILLKDFGIQPNYEENLHVMVPENIAEESVIENFDDNNIGFLFDPIVVTDLPFEEDIDKNDGHRNTYPTPPRSDNMPSPMSDKSYSSTGVDYIYMSSPSMSSPNSEYEKYQEIQPIDDYPTSLDNLEEDSNSNQTIDRNARERNSSTSSMTMKQFKDLQREIASGFSNKECCQSNRKSCKEFFQERFNKIPVEERKRLLVKVASLDFKTAYGVLHHVLHALSSPKVESEDIQYSLFALIAEQILSKGPALFLDQYGLNLLKSAVLRCQGRPELTRYLVRCIRTALKFDAERTKEECVFKEVDERGDNLVLACVRMGDSCAGTLAEITRCADGEQPLFNIMQNDDEGHTALHVACKEHSASNSRLHIIHVLLEHAAMDLWRGDVKGGDTALHLAVNSPTCDLRLVLLLFSRLDRKEWKKLAHVPNRSSCKPLEYARSAAKSKSRQDYPQQVFNFLQKCR